MTLVLLLKWTRQAPSPVIFLTSRTPSSGELDSLLWKAVRGCLRHALLTLCCVLQVHGLNTQPSSRFTLFLALREHVEHRGNLQHEPRHGCVMYIIRKPLIKTISDHFLDVYPLAEVWCITGVLPLMFGSVCVCQGCLQPMISALSLAEVGLQCPTTISSPLVQTRMHVWIFTHAHKYTYEEWN